VGVSKAMQKVYQLVKMAAASDSGVIIYGETGTGKNLVAKTIHDLSGRKGRYVPVNCGAIPEQLMESEFFGYVRGAFSGAATDHKGYLASADGGTLFLDEIGELSLHLQVKLLWALESRLFTPLGSNTPRGSEFRIIAATNRNLKDLVNEKKMRLDFFYRVQVLPIHLPPLRERPEDINPLIDSFLVRYSQGREIPLGLPKALRSAMNRYHWPGNVRELQHFIERYITFGDAVFSDPITAPAHALDSDPGPDGETIRRMTDARGQMERKMILEALDQCRWNRAGAARLLGISLRTLYRKMSRLGLK
jgi:transcriptional regulator with PAS, ATPase and Fis domain